MIKSVGKSEHGCCDYKTSRNITCCAEMREIFVWREGGLVVCRLGELGLGRRRRNKGGEGQQRGDILTFFDGFTDGFVASVIPSVILTKKLTRHRTYLLFQIPRWFRQHFKRRNGHVTVRAVVLTLSVIPLEKLTPPKPPRQRPAFFYQRKHFRP